DYFRLLSRYNRWANGRLYEAASRVNREDYFRDRQAFFGSLHGTLNHILVGDRIWISRIEGRDSGISRLDEILYDDLDSLWSARESFDETIINTLLDMKPGRLESDLSYRTTSGLACVTPLRLVIGHLFNHATHHRGQAHGLLSQTAVAPPVLDLIYFLREE
ncbi:MAG: DinB family protein, partial [Rhodospirillales bacterium]